MLVLLRFLFVAWLSFSWLATPAPAEPLMATGNDRGLWILRPRENDTLLIQFHGAQNQDPDRHRSLIDGSVLLLSGQITSGALSCSDYVLWLAYDNTPFKSPPANQTPLAPSKPPASTPNAGPGQRLVQSVHFDTDADDFGNRPEIKAHTALPAGVTLRFLAANAQGPWALVRVETRQALDGIDRPTPDPAGGEKAPPRDRSPRVESQQPHVSAPTASPAAPSTVGRDPVPVERLIKLDDGDWVRVNLPEPWPQGAPCWLVMSHPKDALPTLVSASYSRAEQSVVSVHQHGGSHWETITYPLAPLGDPGPATDSTPVLRRLSVALAVDGQLIVGQAHEANQSLDIEFFLLRSGQTFFVGALHAPLGPSSRWAVTPFGNTIALATSDKDGRVQWMRMNLQGQATPLEPLQEPRQSLLTERADFVVWTAVLFISLIGMFVFWRRDPARNQLHLPEGVVLADLGRRLSSGVVDLLPCVATTTIVFGIRPQDLYKHWPGEGTAWDSLLPGAITIALLVLHTTITELIWRRSLGKAILGLRVVNLQGEPPEPWQVLLRNLTKALDLIAWPLIALLFIGPYRQRLGDLIATTVVVRDAPKATPSKNKKDPQHQSPPRGKKED